ncbi:putative integral membrane protein [Cryptosporidium meleagridis]|uniref:Putative integral membrane protein n=1 Tax=Cryptosporidium meleagridis TaxID=93969 RepID=A0A2P4Z173_9CRYT|nr:putative integral membrane protein [Cryptosporidium meleagridis]
MSIKKFLSHLLTVVLLLFLFNYGFEQGKVDQVFIDHSYLNLRRPFIRRLLRCFGCCGGKCKKKKSEAQNRDWSLPPPPPRSCLKKTRQDSQSQGGESSGGKRVRFNLEDEKTSDNEHKGFFPKAKSIKVLLGMKKPDSTKGEDSGEDETRF